MPPEYLHVGGTCAGSRGGCVGEAANFNLPPGDTSAGSGLSKSALSRASLCQLPIRQATSCSTQQHDNQLQVGHVNHLDMLHNVRHCQPARLLGPVLVLQHQVLDGRVHRQAAPEGLQAVLQRVCVSVCVCVCVCV